jgi:hypothetical protein
VVVNFVRAWSDKMEIAAGRLIAWIGVARGKFFEWKKRYGKANEHNACRAIPGCSTTRSGRSSSFMIAKTITVNQQTCYGITTTPKRRTRHTIPMTNTLEQALRRLSRAPGFVVRNLDGSAKTDGRQTQRSSGSVVAPSCR